MRQGTITIVLVLLVSLSGCSFLGGSAATTETATGTTTETTTETSDGTVTETTSTTATATSTETAQRAQVRVVDGELSIDATGTFYRVQNVTGSEVRPPTVELRNLTERKNFAPGASPLLSTLGFENVSLAPSEPGGLTTTTTGRVFLHQGTGSPDEIEQVLAHEYVHTVQFQSGMLPWLDTIDRPRRTTDLIFVRKMLIEGSAVYATDDYTARHLDTENQSTEIERRFERGNASERLFWGQYRHGYEYADSEIDSSRNLATVFEEYPNSTEQILHEEGTVDTSPVALSVTQEAPNRDYLALATDTQGEFVLRSTLATEVPSEDATAAATGWGNDSLASFQHTSEDGRFGWVWTIRMDDASESDELATTLSTYAERRSAASELTFETARLDDRTVALTFGTDAFVENATTTATGDGVTVTAGE